VVADAGVRGSGRSVTGGHRRGRRAAGLTIRRACRTPRRAAGCRMSAMRAGQGWPPGGAEEAYGRVPGEAAGDPLRRRSARRGGGRAPRDRWSGRGAGWGGAWSGRTIRGTRSGGSTAWPGRPRCCSRRWPSWPRCRGVIRTRIGRGRDVVDIAAAHTTKSMIRPSPGRSLRADLTGPPQPAERGVSWWAMRW